MKRDRYACDIPHTHGRREGRRESLEVGDIARLIGIVVPPRSNGQAVPEAFQLYEAQAKSEVGSGSRSG